MDQEPALLGQTFILCFIPGMGAAPPLPPPATIYVGSAAFNHSDHFNRPRSR